MRVKNVMSKNILFAHSETTYEEAAKLMYENNLSGLPVIDNKGNLVGIISREDIYKSILKHYLNL